MSRLSACLATNTVFATILVVVDDISITGAVDLSYLWRSLPPLGDWVERAACAGLGWGSDVFTADKPDRDEKALAERTCRRCPVRAECADYAVSAPVYGMWAGRWFSHAAGQRNAA